jgi:hypothetical protein
MNTPRHVTNNIVSRMPHTVHLVGIAKLYRTLDRSDPHNCYLKARQQRQRLRLSQPDARTPMAQKGLDCNSFADFRFPALFCALSVLLCELISRPYAGIGICDDGSLVVAALPCTIQRLTANGWIDIAWPPR